MFLNLYVQDAQKSVCKFHKQCDTHAHNLLGRWSGRSRQQTRLDLVLLPLPVLYRVAERFWGGDRWKSMQSKQGRRVGSPILLHAVCRYGLTSSRNAISMIKSNYFVHIKRICIEGLPLTLLLTGSHCQPLPRNPKNPIPVFQTPPLHTTNKKFYKSR